jgi:hypothetical protein
LGAEGREHIANSGGKRHVATERGTESGTLSDDSTPKRPAMDPDLADVMTAWPTLAKPIRDAIKALVKAAGG